MKSGTRLAGMFRRLHARERLRPPRRLAAGLAIVALVLLAACGPTQQPVAVGRLQASIDPPASALDAALKLRGIQMTGETSASQRLLLRQAADWYVARMSLDDQLGQMLLNESDGTVYSPDMAVMVEQQHIGGLIIFGDNYGTFDQTRQLFAQVQAHAPIPLFIATDQEGGGITRISQYYGYFPSPRQLGDSGDLQSAFDWGKQTAEDLQQLGINTNFAPVVDVSVNGGEPWSATRTYSEDPKVVAEFAAATMAGQHSVGEVTALKHFPGLGSITDDPHKVLPTVYRTWDQLQQTELYPYRALIPQMPDMIMSTDILVPAVDDSLPAELSPKWINGVLRTQMGYDGVVITDALWMKGISDTWSLGQAAVLAVLAGSDIMIAAYNSYASQSVLDALKAAIASGQISRARIAQSVERILMLKIKYHMLPIPPSVLATQPLASP